MDMINSEYKPLRAVLLHKPGPEIAGVENPGEILHQDRIDYHVIDEEYEFLLGVLNKLKIKVCFMDSNQMEGAGPRYVYNMMYCRDLFFMTPTGAILSRMATDVRKDEVKFAEKILRRIGIPIRRTIDGSGMFEGADALWVNERTVIVGVGHRTNVEGYEQIRNELQHEGIRCVLMPSTQRVTQHLLGVLQFVDSNLAFVRNELMDKEIVALLEKHDIRWVNIPENEEVRNRQAMNILTVAPREIIMGANCPVTKKIFQSANVRVMAEVPISQLINGGGGLACAAAPVERVN